MANKYGTVAYIIILSLIKSIECFV